MDFAHGIFPDTLANALTYNSQLFATMGSNKIFFHAIGNVLDVRSDIFKTVDGLTWDATTPVRVDSIGVGYMYFRNHPDPGIVDTMLVYVYNNNAAANLPELTYPDHPVYNKDVVCKFLKYAYTQNKPNGTGVTVVKIPLYAADTTGDDMNRVLYFGIPPMDVNAGKLIASSVVFKPGYTYTEGDTITTNKNYFCFVSSEENGMNTWPTYTDGDYNLSSLVTYTERYNYPMNQYNGYFVPTYGWGGTMWEFEHHQIYYHVSAITTGVEQTEAFGISLYQNEPNPFNGSSKITYTLPAASDISLELSDLTGKKVRDIDAGKKEAGAHEVMFNADELPAGIYLYTLRTEQGTLNKKMIITR